MSKVRADHCRRIIHSPQHQMAVSFYRHFKGTKAESRVIPYNAELVWVSAESREIIQHPVECKDHHRVWTCIYKTHICILVSLPLTLFAHEHQ